MDMTKLTKARRAATRDFLVAYELRKKLARIDADDIVVDSSPEEDAAAREECARLVRPFDGDIAVGQVRALSGVQEITYALVARKWDERSWLVIPFSSFSVPATDTELRLKVDGGVGLRVVQLWNARSLLTETVAKSWLVSTLSDEDVADVVSAWQWSVGIGGLSGDQLARTGMPIMRRDDPRIEYEDEALANFAELDSADFAAAERMSWRDSVREVLGKMARSPFCQSPVFETDYALAAADAEKSVSAECRVDGFDGVVYIRYAPSTRSLNMRVFGADGNRSAALDGWSVLGSGAEPLGVVEGASFKCAFDERFDGVLALADDEGNVFSLTEGK
jgi:hypothetical protein